jgi:N-acetylglucosaminyldiphosphoundecaprenol N-acetyl-beta-D-mannosaminyltransferase
VYVSRLEPEAGALPAAGVASVVGVDLHDVTMEQTQRAVMDAVRAEARPALHVATVTLDHLALAARDVRFRDVLRSSGLSLADGMGAVWLARLAGFRLPARVSGATLTEWMVDGGLEGRSLFLLGSTEEVVSKVARRAGRNGVRIAGGASPTRDVFDSSPRSGALVADINRAGADVLLVALGAPLQETWISVWREDLEVSVAIGVGGSLDFAAGRVPRAPLWMQRLGLEWFHRLTHEPRRLAGRYVGRDMPFLAREAVRLAWSRVLAGR